MDESDKEPTANSGHVVVNLGHEVIDLNHNYEYVIFL